MRNSPFSSKRSECFGSVHGAPAVSCSAEDASSGSAASVPGADVSGAAGSCFAPFPQDESGTAVSAAVSRMAVQFRMMRFMMFLLTLLML